MSKLKIFTGIKSLVESIEKMSVIDLAELVKVLEDKFGVSAAAPAMMMTAPAAAGADAVCLQRVHDLRLVRPSQIQGSRRTQRNKVEYCCMGNSHINSDDVYATFLNVLKSNV